MTGTYRFAVVDIHEVRADSAAAAAEGWNKGWIRRDDVVSRRYVHQFTDDLISEGLIRAGFIPTGATPESEDGR